VKNSGVTLTELIVVIAIVGILVVALGFSFQGWIGKYKVEAATKQIYSDLMDARARAMQFNRIYYVQVVDATTTYSLIEDSNDDSGNNDAAIPGFPKTVEYTINWNGGGAITFNKRGNISNLGTICIFTDADGDGTSDSDPDYDCIEIAQTRINIGKITNQAGGCGAPNCVAK